MEARMPPADKNGEHTQAEEIKVPHKLDYNSPKPREPSRFWSELFSEIRSEFAEIPLWLLLAVGGIVMMLITSFFYGVYLLGRA
jgi:hypothetical protein